MKPLLPAALVAVFASFCGTLSGGATATGSAVAVGSLLLFALAGLPDWRDPWGLGASGRWLPVAAAGAVVASWWASPVSRAGLLVVVLLPALYLLPAAVARCWADRWDRRLGQGALAAVVAAFSAWVLFDHYVLGSPRAVMPLGHHLLVAEWLVLLLPLAVLGVREPGLGRWLSVTAAVLGAAAVAATRSVSGGLALAFELALAAVLLKRRGPRWPLVVGAVAVALAPLVARWTGLFAGRDTSLLARLVYWQAGWEGVGERPLLGWGPVSTPWTLGLHLRPLPGINPPAEVVADLHSVPLQMLYELGFAAPLLVLVALVLAIRRRLRTGSDPAWTTAAVLGLAGFAVASVAGVWSGASALPVAAAVVFGAVLASSSPHETPRGEQRGSSSPSSRWLPRLAAGVYLLLAAWIVVPLVRAERSYERAAVELEDGDLQLRAVERAVELDPTFPLYRWIAGDLLPDAAEQLRAAEGAPGVGALWLGAGMAGAETRAPWAAEALERACRLDPLGAMASFRRVRLDPDAPDAEALAARALLAEPRLAASPFWRDHDDLRRRAVDRIQVLDGVDAGWRLALAAAVTDLPAGPAAAFKAPPELADLVQHFDQEVAPTASQVVFRRVHWPADLALEPLEIDLAMRLGLPPASGLATTEPRVLSPETCSPEREPSPALPRR